MGSKKMWCRTLGSLVYPLIVFFLIAASPAAAQIEFSRPVDIGVTVEPQVLTLEKSEVFRPENPVGNAVIVLVPDRKIVAKNDGDRDALNALGRLAQLFSGTYPRQSATGNLPPLIAEALRKFEEEAKRMPPGMTMNVSARFENNPALNASLAADGYQPFAGSQANPPDEEPITFRFWAKTDMSSAVKRGTASATFHLVNNAVVDPNTTVIHGNFSVRQDSKMDITEVPDIAEVREIAKGLYAEFSKRAKSELNTALATLNKPSLRLTRAELTSVAQGATGAEIRFNKKITITWYGEPRDVNLVIIARPGPFQTRGSPAPDNTISIQK